MHFRWFHRFLPVKKQRERELLKVGFSHHVQNLTHLKCGHEIIRNVRAEQSVLEADCPNTADAQVPGTLL